MHPLKMTFTKLLVACAFALAGEAAVAHGDAATAHGSGHDATAFGRPANAAKASRAIGVTMSDDMRFTPASFTVRKGETVRFVVRNDGAVEPELVIGTDETLREHAREMREMPGMEHVDPNMVRVLPGAKGELTWTFDRAGRFAVGCLVPGHYEAGMKGTVVVR